MYKKLMKVQEELKAPKGQFNNFGKYKYRSCEDILEAAKPLCVQNELLLTLQDEIVSIDGRFYIKAIASVSDKDGNKIETTAYAREPESKKGMDDSQITGTASSYARKYALNGLFCIDDTKDADTDEHKKQTTQNTTPKKPKQTTSYKGVKASPKVTKAEIAKLLKIAETKGVTKEQLEKGAKKRYNCTLNEMAKDNYNEMIEGVKGMETV